MISIYALKKLIPVYPAHIIVVNILSTSEIHLSLQHSIVEKYPSIIEKFNKFAKNYLAKAAHNDNLVNYFLYMLNILILDRINSEK